MRQNEKSDKRMVMPLGMAIALATSLFAVCVSITGCGGEFAGVNRAVSGGAVSGSVVSGGAVRENAEDSQQTVHTEVSKYPYSTDTNVYYEDYNDKDEACIIQARFDGSHKKEIVNAGDEDEYEYYVHYVDENWLYYELETDDKNRLYRVPIKKDGDGYDTVNISGQEELIREPNIYSYGWNTGNVLLDNMEDKVIRYDLQKKKTVSEWSYADLGMDDECDLDIYQLNDYYIALTELGEVYAMESDGTQWKKCHGSEKCDWIGINTAQTENSLFFDISSDDDIRKCDGKSVQVFITNEQMKQAAKKAKGMGAETQIEVCDADEMYVDGNRLYIQLELHWKEDEVYRIENLLFSQGENEAELRYEKELTECMHSYVKSRTGKLEDYAVRTPLPGETLSEDAVVDLTTRVVLEEHAVINTAQCVAMLNGKAYLSLYENDKGRMGCYELSTGNFRWITPKEAKYGELRWMGVVDNNDINILFGPEEKSQPVRSGKGYFVETEE